jgi:hypothetical protein
VVRARVLVRGKRVKVRRRAGGRRVARVNLRGLRKGRYRVVLRLKTTGRREHVVVRRFRTCAPRGR